MASVMLSSRDGGKGGLKPLSFYHGGFPLLQINTVLNHISSKKLEISNTMFSI